MDYRIIQEPEILEQVVDLEIEVGGLLPRDAMPVNMLRPIALHGGLVIGAFDGRRLIGSCVGFPARSHGQWVLWSHITCVKPGYQGQGIGYALKQQQREWAGQNHYREIRWTFDPLQRGNANFNLHVLGATTSIYHVNYYGLMADEINKSIVSDRVEAVWRVKPSAKRQDHTGLLDTNPFLLCASAEGQPLLMHDISGPTLLVQAPSQQTSVDQLVEWRMVLREALQAGFERGYTAVDFVQRDGIGAYVLRAAVPWYLYVLRCADDTLYTGISNDLEHRLKQHMSGRGAAYTRSRRPVNMIAAWQFAQQASARKAEAAFKQLSRTSKLHQIEKQLPYRDGTFFDLKSL
jgi:predicted GNAT superfamily acetyltransferase/predicted GIY-YIG superfamily endonuclease